MRKFKGKASRSLSPAAVSVALAFGLGAAPVSFAAEGAIEEVVVTGSYIRGTPEDAALPVDVIDQAEMEMRGSPTRST